MEGRENRLEVEIFGETYTIVGDASTDHIVQVAQFVNRRMKQLAARNPKLSRAHVAVLAALNAAEELLKLREEHDNLVKMIESENKTENKKKKNNP